MYNILSLIAQAAPSQLVLCQVCVPESALSHAVPPPPYAQICVAILVKTLH